MDRLQDRRGAWLEAFLNPATRVDDYYSGSGKAPGFRTLTRDALDILGITQKFLDVDLSLKALELILASPSDIRDFYDPEKEGFVHRYDSILSNNDPLKLLTAIFPRQKQGEVKSVVDFALSSEADAHFTDELLSYYHRIFFDALITQKIWIRCFQAIAINKKPWGETLYHMRREVPYGALSEGAYFNHEKQAMDLGRWLDNANCMRGNNSKSAYFPWPAACLNIALNFLKNGGQSRFILCEQCGRFAFIRREGKKFCSDICRVRSNNQAS